MRRHAECDTMKSEFITQEVAAMLRLHQLKLSLDQAAGLDSKTLKALCAARLNIAPGKIRDARLKKRSVDARMGVHFIPPAAFPAPPRM